VECVAGVAKSLYHFIVLNGGIGDKMVDSSLSKNKKTEADDG
jgi:hypothetical protein